MSPEQRAREIVNRQFEEHDALGRGFTVGDQENLIAKAIREAVAEEREKWAAVADRMTFEGRVEETRGHRRVSLIAEAIREGSE